MRFEPKTDKQISEAGLWPKGVYDFEIMDSADAVSKKGNEMIKLQVKVYNKDGGYILLFDYLLESMAYKLKHCSEACGLTKEYEGGSLIADNFKGKSGKLELSIQAGEGDYLSRNSVKDYIVPSEPVKLEDEIPF